MTLFRSRHGFLIPILLMAFIAVPCASVIPAMHDDDHLARAAARIRDKSWQDARTIAAKAPDSPQRAFLMGIASLRSGKPLEAVSLLAEAEQKLPAIADYALFYRAEALSGAGQGAEAHRAALSIPVRFPSSPLLRRAEKLAADALFESGDFASARKAYEKFTEKHSFGNDALDSLYMAARSRESGGDPAGAAAAYRSLVITNPSSPQAEKASDRLAELKKKGVTVQPFSPDDLFARASALSSQGHNSRALAVLRSIPSTLPAHISSRVSLLTGQSLFRLKQYREAAKHFEKLCAEDRNSRNECRYWLARIDDRAGNSAKALESYLSIASEGRRSEHSDAALHDAAVMLRDDGRYQEASSLFDRLAREFPQSRFMQRNGWERAWCRYRSGDYRGAADILKGLTGDQKSREKHLYWQARSLEKAGSSDAAALYSQLLEEFPSGFYAHAYRDLHGVPDTRGSLAAGLSFSAVPTPQGFDRVRLLMSLGMTDDARAEISAERKKWGDRISPASLMRVYLENEDYPGAIAYFRDLKTQKWEKDSWLLWTGGYPLGYRELVTRNASLNGISPALVHALIKAESSYIPGARSPAGAIGLMQMMPATAKATAREKGHFNPMRLVNPEENIRLGTRHLSDLIKSWNGDLIAVVASYNAGSTPVEKWQKRFRGLKMDEFVESIPYQETRDYVKKVYAGADTYRKLYGMK